MKKVIEITFNLLIHYLPIALMLTLFLLLTLGGGMNKIFILLSNYNLG